MARLWEFGLGCAGKVATGQIVIAEGADEAVAAEGAQTDLNLPHGAVLIRPGSPASPQETARWRSLCSSFPLVLSVAGRIAQFGRGR